MKRALLAEDDPVNRAFLCEALSLLGWEAAAFETGEDAAKAAIAQAFDVLLLDLNLPGADGIAILRQIRNLDSHASADTPAIALTADHTPEQHQQLRRQGFDSVETKPLAVERLAQALAALGLASDIDPPQAQHVTAAPADAELPVWDDASALTALAGNAVALAALRKLMLADLPTQRDRILTAPQSPRARDDLHRLRAACGFCGATLLARSVAELERTTTEVSLATFVYAVEQTLDTPPA
ncbi:response regulator [Xanthomonadaceae bacterium JHOS43]|nr:response regulator [Xanthomonadaceae bacterium JHOS43]MCX7563513.1 response regulator [Xanthomonadaceae bacterium XH05]